MLPANGQAGKKALPVHPLTRCSHPVQSLQQMDVGSSQSPEQLGQTKPKGAKEVVNVWQHHKSAFALFL